MAADLLDGRVAVPQRRNQVPQRLTLCVGSGVRRLLVDQAADVADADCRCVVVEAMCALLLDGSASLDRSVNVDDEMVADAVPAFGLVPLVDVFCLEVLARLGSGAMDNDFVNLPHFLFQLSLFQFRC